MLADAVQAFEAAYRHAVQACLAHRLPLVVCTVYHGNFPEPTYQRRVGVALTAFNDVIVRAAIDNRLKVIDLRRVCNAPDDYANPIEPSSVGGTKIAEAIVRAVTEAPHTGRGAQVVA